ncbi:unnamed protein product [Cylindrotheca closterium]|uniref:Uncharacterized protein n=1 Tax=Cylindrotheca closterium TaxID=2856 RepID=A0AAD2FG19_9STRA|nr:unnamed protein product [Cylindrotheca closterium]
MKEELLPQSNLSGSQTSKLEPNVQKDCIEPDKMMAGRRESLFSLSLRSQPSYCSELSWDSEDEDDSDSSCFSEDDYLDAQIIRGDFILEKPLDAKELDRLFDWGVGYKAPPKFTESVHDFPMKVPTRRDSITDNDTFSRSDEFRNDIFRSTRSDAFESVLSAISDEFESRDLDSLDSRFSLDDEEKDDPKTPPTSKGRNNESCMVEDGAESIADSAYGSNSSTLEDRWTEGGTHEKLQPSVNRWRDGLTPDKSLRPSIERPMMPPPRRRPSNSGDDWDVTKRHSLKSSSLHFEIINSQIQAEVGLRMSDSLPAQKIMEAIMSVLQNPDYQEESKEESKYEQ